MRRVKGAAEAIKRMQVTRSAAQPEVRPARCLPQRANGSDLLALDVFEQEIALDDILLQNLDFQIGRRIPVDIRIDPSVLA